MRTEPAPRVTRAADGIARPWPFWWLGLLGGGFHAESVRFHIYSQTILQT